MIINPAAEYAQQRDAVLLRKDRCIGGLIDGWPGVSESKMGGLGH